MVKLECSIDSIVYSDRNTGFYILRVSPNSPNNGKNVAVKGNFAGINMIPGLKVLFKGEWFDDPKYGRQLHASSFDLLQDNTKVGIISYLTANVPSIGPITANKLYSAFGSELVTILEDEPERVGKLDFLTRVQSDAIIAEWKNSSQARTTSIFLSDLGLAAFHVKLIFNKYGIQSIDMVKNNPYLIADLNGISFQTADSVARKMGVGVDDPRRVRAMVMFIMNDLAFSDGHMWVTSDLIRSSVGKMFRRLSLTPFSHGEYISDSHYFDALDTLKNNKSIISSGNKLYLSVNWKHESDAALNLADRILHGPVDFKGLGTILKKFEKTHGITLSRDQRDAFMTLEKSRVCVVSGYPGTGKTTLISAFVNLFEEASLNYVLLSPTGIAAKRLSKITKKQASTIHRALGCTYDGTWEFSQYNKYSVDAVIVDEMSMVDSSTFYHLVTATSDECILILVGDSAQLPSVGAGYVLNSLLQCQDVPHVSLTRIYRQEGSSDIIRTAHSILAGSDIDTSYVKSSEFVFLEFKKDVVIDEIKKLTSIMKNRGDNFQVIAPVYNGDLGVNNLNSRLREILNSDFVSCDVAKLKHGSCDLYEGDRVMIVKNDYDMMVFNGDVGKVQSISLKKNKIDVKVFDWFDYESATPRYVDKILTFTVEEARRSLRVAYACTTHKVQGQEFDYVIIPMTMQYGIMLYRNLIYTAITRAKKKVFVFGESRAFQYAVNNDRETIRNSDLSELVKRYTHSLSAPANSESVGGSERIACV